MLQLLSLLTLLTFQLGSSLIEVLQGLKGWVIAWSSLHINTSSRWGGGADEGIERDIGLERWHGSSEQFHRTPGEWGYVLYPISPLHGVGVPQSWNMEVASKDTGSPKEIGWKKCPGGDHSHLGRVAWRLITEWRGYWYTSSPHILLAWMSQAGEWWWVPLRPPSWSGYDYRK